MDQEQRVQEFRERYAGQLSAQVPANLQIMQGWQTQLQALMEELRQERDRRTRLQELVSNGAAAAPKEEGPKENGDGAEPARTTEKTDAATLPADPVRSSWRRHVSRWMNC